MSLEKDIRQKAFESIHQKTLLNIIYTSEWITKRLNVIFKEHGVTGPQFNILRILAGSFPKPISPGEIKEVMISSSSDLTRLLDRLEKKEMITRANCPTNRRKMEVLISEQGQKTLAILNPVIKSDTFNFYENKLSANEATQLNQLLEKLRAK